MVHHLALSNIELIPAQHVVVYCTGSSVPVFIVTRVYNLQGLRCVLLWLSSYRAPLQWEIPLPEEEDA
jgi:hypothetical protein